VDDAVAKRTSWIQELKTEIKSTSNNDIDKIKDNISTLQSKVDLIIKSMQTAIP